MIVRPYDNVRDLRHILSLLANYSFDSALAADLPKFGLIAIENNIPIAAGFLREVEGDYAMLDSYITNSSVDGALRNKALDLITSKLMKIAEHNNVVKLIAFTKSESIFNRSLKHGFNASPHLVSVKRL
jgi:hypothetical protein